MPTDNPTAEQHNLVLSRNSQITEHNNLALPTDNSFTTMSQNKQTCPAEHSSLADKSTPNPNSTTMATTGNPTPDEAHLPGETLAIYKLLNIL